jgi:hypothetical protein
MKEAGQHIVVHSRVNADETEFIGSEAYEEYVRVDNELLRASYKNPVPARTSPILLDDWSIPTVGNTTVAGFLGSGRLLAPSSDPQPLNSDGATSEPSPDISTAQPSVEWVTPELKLDKNKAEPITFSTESGLEVRTG